MKKIRQLAAIFTAPVLLGSLVQCDKPSLQAESRKPTAAAPVQAEVAVADLIAVGSRYSDVELTSALERIKAEEKQAMEVYAVRRDMQGLERDITETRQQMRSLRNPNGLRDAEAKLAALQKDLTALQAEAESKPQPDLEQVHEDVVAARRAAAAEFEGRKSRAVRKAINSLFAETKFNVVLNDASGTTRTEVAIRGGVPEKFEDVTESLTGYLGEVMSGEATAGATAKPALPLGRADFAAVRKVHPNSKSIAARNSAAKVARESAPANGAGPLAEIKAQIKAAESELSKRELENLAITARAKRIYEQVKTAATDEQKANLASAKSEVESAQDATDAQRQVVRKLKLSYEELRKEFDEMDKQRVRDRQLAAAGNNDKDRAGIESDFLAAIEKVISSRGLGLIIDVPAGEDYPASQIHAVGHDNDTEPVDVTAELSEQLRKITKQKKE